jgi:SPP1 family predicted phage head-tail adaptor
LLFECVEFGGGAHTTSWATSTTIWGNVQVQGTNQNTYFESYKDEKKQQYTSFDVTIRKNSNVTNETRFIFNGKILVVEATEDIIQRNKLQKCRCRLEVV